MRNATYLYLFALKDLVFPMGLVGAVYNELQRPAGIDLFTRLVGVRFVLAVVVGCSSSWKLLVH